MLVPHFQQNKANHYYVGVWSVNEGKETNECGNLLFCTCIKRWLNNDETQFKCFTMGRKRTSGVSHNKNSKTYKTTDRQSASSAYNHPSSSSSKITSFFIRTGSQQNEVILFFCLYSNFNFFISLSQEDCQFNITLLTCRISTKRFRDLIVMKSMLYYLLFMNGYSSAACLLKYDW